MRHAATRRCRIDRSHTGLLQQIGRDGQALLIPQSLAHKQSQETFAARFLDGFDSLIGQGTGLKILNALVCFGKHIVDQAMGVVQVRVERAAESVNIAHAPGARLGRGARTVFTEALLDKKLKIIRRA